MRAATNLLVAALLCAVGVGADDGPIDLEKAPHLISKALRKLAKGVHKVLKHGAPHGNVTGAPLFQYFAIPTTEAADHANQTLFQIQQGIDEVSMDIEDWVANMSKNDMATKETDSRDLNLTNNEVLKLTHATARVYNASQMRSAPKAAEIERLQKIKDQLNAEIQKRKPRPPPPKEPLASGNIHAFEKYLFAPSRGQEPAPKAPKPTAPPPVAVKQNSSQVQKVKTVHAPMHTRITSKDVADEVISKQKEEQQEESRKAEEIAEVAHNKSLASLKHKKVKMSRKLRGYLRMPTSPPPVKNEEQKEVHVSAGRKHLLAAQDILAKMSVSANSSMLNLPSAMASIHGPTTPAKPKVHAAPLAPKKAATSELQLSKFWAIPKDSTNIWPWIKGGVHM